MKSNLLRKLMVSAVCLAGLTPLGAVGQGVIKTYRGSIGGNHIEMRLNFEGQKISGTYSYDRIRQDLKLSGRLDEQGRLELAEFGAKGKPTGKLVCAKRLDDPLDPDCNWSRPDGTGQAFVTLEEQHVAMTGGLRIVPKVISNRQSGVSVSYPQIAGDGPLGAAIENFNRLIAERVTKTLKEFEPEAIPGRTSFETNYNVLLGSNELVSIELKEYTDAGGAHPNTRFWALTYDLSANRELELSDLFNSSGDYKAAIANYVVADIDRRARALEQEEARREGRKAEPRGEALVSVDQLDEPVAWGLTPQGIAIYFDFAHAIAVFDKTFVPFAIVKDYLKPDGPTARVARVR